MDTDMIDAAYDIDLDLDPPYEAPVSAPAPVPQQVVETSTQKDANAVPAAYYESLEPQEPQKAWPEALNLQGVNTFDPNDPLYYAMEHCGAEPRVKQLRWVNDSSVNLEFYSAEDAAKALELLTHADAGHPSAHAPQQSRRAKPYSKKPDSVLLIRETNAGDQKPKGAANRSNYYRQNPDVRPIREREPRQRQQPPQPARVVLDYGDEDVQAPPPERRRRRSTEDISMHDESRFDRRRGRDNDRKPRMRRESRDRNGNGRLGGDVDSYRPSSRSPRESRFGRLRGRSASPAPGDEGDGRYGFAEDTVSLRRRYRSPSREPPPRRRRSPSPDRWTHDRAHYGSSGGRWQKDSAPTFETSPMGNHRRTDAMDETALSRKSGSLLSRMTKDGKPVAPSKRSLADRITRAGDADFAPAAASTRESSFGRLKDDFSMPRDTGFAEPRQRRGLLAERMTRVGGVEEGVRGVEGINIRGVAGGL